MFDLVPRTPDRRQLREPERRERLEPGAPQCPPRLQGFRVLAAGVGLATTRTVVTCSVLILLIDYMLTAAFLTIS